LAAGFMAVGAYLSASVSLALKDDRLGFVPEGVSDQVFLRALAVGWRRWRGELWLSRRPAVAAPEGRLPGHRHPGFGEIILVIVRNAPGLGGALGLSGTPQHTSFFSASAFFAMQ
jgi:hypothetical protein